MSDSTESNEIIGSGPDFGDAEATHEYWTAERRAQARPVPMPRPSTGERPAAMSEAGVGEGETGHEPPSRRGDEGAGGDPSDGSRSLVAGGNPVASPLAYPYRTCGKLYFSQGGHDYAGSASIVANNVLLTAGHCVFGGGSWSTNVAFYPSYPSRASSDPLFRFSYSYLAAWTAWTQSSNRAFDYGMIWVDNAPGQSLGWLGLLWNASTAGRSAAAVGYPATPAPPFNGEIMDEAVGSYQGGTVSGTVGLSNDNMEHGSSGGPWITDFNGSSREYANGLQSFHVTDGDLVEYGPSFTADVKGLLDWISNPANRTAKQAAVIS